MLARQIVLKLCEETSGDVEDLRDALANYNLTDKLDKTFNYLDQVNRKGRGGYSRA